MVRSNSVGERLLTIMLSKPRLKHVTDGVLILGPGEPRECTGAPGPGFLDGRAVEHTCEQADEGVVRSTRRPHLTRRRHLASDELSHELLAGVRIPAHV